MASKTAFFNKFLCSNPDYVPVKDYNNVLKHIIVMKPPNSHIKIKFAKYRLMEQPAHFYRAQRAYHILYKFVQHCKAKYIKYYNNDQDLCGNPLRNPLTLVEHKTAYKFSIQDLQKVIINALLNQNHLVPDPVHPKNPYTNLPFSKHNLLIIYAFTPKRHPLFNIFYNSNFDINTIKDNNRRTLVEYAINTYTQEYNEDCIDDIYYMCVNIRLHDEFPKDVLYRVFRPYLKELYKAQYLYCRSAQSGTLGVWLNCFELYNPYFGMKYIDKSGCVKYDDRHLEFSQITGVDANRFIYIANQKYIDIPLSPIADATYYDNDDIDNIDDIDYDSDNNSI